MYPTQSIGQFSCASYIKEIGRGKEGARGISREQAETLFRAILRGEVSDFELGAVLIALRVKGESMDELTGFMRAISTEWPIDGALGGEARDDGTVSANLDRLNLQSRNTGKPVVVIPSYNGARRKPNFTPLLAALLAKRGYPVLVHGQQQDPNGRVTTCEVMQHLNWQGHTKPCFISLHDLYPRLQHLLDTRKALGVRTCTHTLVKLLVPASFSHSILITGYTHPEFWNLQRDVLSALNQTSLVIRAHEGEPVASPYRSPRMDAVKNGKTWCIADQEPRATEQPEPHPDIDALATARLIERWLAQPELIPHGFLAQLNAVDAVVEAS